MKKLIIVLLLTSCSVLQKKQEKKQYSKLKKFESNLVNKDLTINKHIASYIYSNALKYLSNFPKSVKKEEVLILAAKSSDGLNLNKENIKIIDSLLVCFPNSINAPIYLYNKGKVYEEKLKDKIKAKEIYNELIIMYPQSKIAKDLIHYVKIMNLIE